MPQYFIQLVVGISFLFAYLIDPDFCEANTNGFSATNVSSQIKISKIELAPALPLTEVEITHIKNLIKNLSQIDKPDFGLSATLSGDAFAPIASARNFQSGLITNHGIKDSSDFVELVKLGPKALPFLLESLDDQTPTKLIINHDTPFGIMSFGHELKGNPANVNEQAILSESPQEKFSFQNAIKSYTATIGDVCFVIIGQIAGRSYQAIRYQPTACIVINSPTHDALLTKQVRTIWQNTNAPQHLLNSLLLDYAGKSNSTDHSTDDWYIDGQWRAGAAMRLLYYFPAESTNFIADRLSKLDVGGSASTPNSMERAIANRVDANTFIKAVAWCRLPVIQSEVRKVFERTDDEQILRSSLEAMDSADSGFYRKRLEEFLNKLPETEGGPYGEGYNLLVELGQRFGADAKPAFQRYMQNASLQRRRTMSNVLRATQGQWSIELLTPLLQDTRLADGWTYAVIPDQDEPRLPIRICDEAAETIAGNFPKLSFKMSGEHTNLDVQIKSIRENIARHDY